MMGNLRLPPSGERGSVLLETLVAMVVLVVAGSACLGIARAAVQHASEIEQREREMEIAERVLTATVLLDEADLDRRLGLRTVGELEVQVQRPRRGLYRIGVALSRQPDRELLATLVFRPGLPVAESVR